MFCARTTTKNSWFYTKYKLQSIQNSKNASSSIFANWATSNRGDCLGISKIEFTVIRPPNQFLPNKTLVFLLYFCIFFKICTIFSEIGNKNPARRSIFQLFVVPVNFGQTDDAPALIGWSGLLNGRQKQRNFFFFHWLLRWRWQIKNTIWSLFASIPHVKETPSLKTPDQKDSHIIEAVKGKNCFFT